MVHTSAILSSLALVLSIVHTDAHPGHSHEHTRSLTDIVQRHLYHTNLHRSLAACANQDAARKLNQQAAERRQAKIQALRAEKQRARRLRALAAADVLATTHKANLSNIDPTTVSASTIFGSTNKCVLEPEVTVGPYYVKGELIRNDVREQQQGIDLYAELQFVDTTSCTVVPNYYVDFWHCNSTGVYSGVVASTNGNSNDQTNLDATFARGLYPTDSDGVVQFITKFPGHYAGRTTHIHILGNHDGTVLANKTYSGGSVSSVGQIFFDQSLLTEVEKTGVYATNTQAVTTNAADSIFSEAAATGFDPVMQYVYLGDSVEDGIFAWISVGVDTSLVKSVSAAATLTANGGVATTGTGTGMGGGPGNNQAPGNMDSTPGSSGTPAPVSSSGSSNGSTSTVSTAPASTTPAASSGAPGLSGMATSVAVVVFAVGMTAL